MKCLLQIQKWMEVKHGKTISEEVARALSITLHELLAGLGSITIVIVIDCNRLQLERNRNCNRNQIFQIVA